MPKFQRTDMFAMISGTAYILRLTLGALAEIDARLGVRGPLELAEKLKVLCDDEQSLNDAYHLLECVLRPAFVMCADTGFTNISALAQQADPKVFMPIITRLFEANFKTVTAEST